MGCCIPAGGGSSDLLVSLVTGISVALVVLGRFVAGRPLDGQARTNCSYRRAGTAWLPQAPRPPRWAYQPLARWWSYAPGWHRQMIRISGTAWAGLLTYGLLVSPVLTAASACCLTVLAAATRRRWTAQRLQHTLPPVSPAVDWAEAGTEHLDLLLIAVRAGTVPVRVSARAADLPGVFTGTAHLADQAPITAGEPAAITAGAFTAPFFGPARQTAQASPVSEAIAEAVRDGWDRS